MSEHTPPPAGVIWAPRLFWNTEHAWIVTADEHGKVHIFGTDPAPLLMLPLLGLFDDDEAQ